MKQDIKNLTLNELKAAVTAMGEPAHRAQQIFSWLYGKNADSFSMMTNLPRRFISRLEKKFTVAPLECEKRLRAKDGTEKFLWRLEDGKHVETVLIKHGKRKTLCLSTQVGCRFRCPFCASGAMGFSRNLTVSEIVGQLLSAQKLTATRVTNVVFMGIGEPLDNYDNLVRSIFIINSPQGPAIGARRITVSTCGITPGILKLKDIGLQVELAVSLHASNNELRNELVPINRKYPLRKLIDACKEYHKKTKRIITIEYTLIPGKNDSNGDADKLARIAHEINAKVNLIACNPSDSAASAASDKDALRPFASRLRSKKITVTCRKPRGDDIFAACGQLAGGQS